MIALRLPDDHLANHEYSGVTYAAPAAVRLISLLLIGSTRTISGRCGSRRRVAAAANEKLFSLSGPHSMP